MLSRKPHIAVFFGGTSDNRDLSSQTGHWVCQYIPRTQYRVTPVHVNREGLWQVPLGNLPQTGPVTRMLDMMFQAVPAVPPAPGLERLLRQPVDGLMTVIRGKGGDDGTLQGLGQTLGIPVIGSTASTCQQTSDKHACGQRLEDIVGVPISRRFPHATEPDAMVEEIRSQFTPPVFIKPAAQEGSVGVEAVHSLDELAAAVSRVHSFGDVLVQERARGREITVSLFDDERGQLRVLPPTEIVPHKADFYDHLAKRKPGRVALQTPASSEHHLLAEVHALAEDVYRELNCRGLVGIDCMVGEETTRVLEVNTIPLFTPLAPLTTQLKAAGIHPGALLDRLLRQSVGEYA